MTVRADTVKEDDEVGSSSNSSVLNGRAISVKLGHSLDRAFAKAFEVSGTNTTVKCSSCIAINHLATIEVGFCSYIICSSDPYG